MTPTQTECQSKSFGFGKLEQRQILADLSGGSITSDAGLVLIAQLKAVSDYPGLPLG